MRRAILGILLLLALAMPVSAMEFTAPEAPDSAQALMPAETESFGEGLWQVIKAAVAALQPDVAEAAGICLAVVGAVLLASLVKGMPGGSEMVVRLVCALSISGVLLSSTNAMVRLGTQTVTEMSEYGKLLWPVLAAALAAQGGATSSTALYAGTVAFDTLLCAVISRLLVPMVYIFLVLSVANSVTGEALLKQLRDFVRWLMVWALKTILYVFTGYIGITGVISGTADAATVKAARLTISGMVPVIGGIIADASETIIVGAGVMKSAVGVYGLIAVIAVCIAPFLQIGIQYLMLKAAAALCGIFGVPEASELIQDFSSAMGHVLAMTGSVCFLLLISTVCFMKGMG